MQAVFRFSYTARKCLQSKCYDFHKLRLFITVVFDRKRIWHRLTLIGPVSSYIRQRFLFTRSNVEINSEKLFVVPDPMSSWTRQRFPLYQVKCWVKFDNSFHCTRSNVELDSTALSTVPGPMSSYTRQHFPLYHVKYRTQIVTLFYRVLFVFP